ncbi:MAG TPA: hypothetical protein VGA18_06405, partial [Rhodothermales bacterium]
LQSMRERKCRRVSGERRRILPAAAENIRGIPGLFSDFAPRQHHAELPTSIRASGDCNPECG